jgi:hypothetical protein
VLRYRPGMLPAMRFRDGAQWSHIVSFIKFDECDRLAQEQLAFASGTPIRQAMSPRYPREILKTHLPGIKDKLRNIALGPFKTPGAGF